MRVGRGVAVPWEMLHCCGQTFALHAQSISRGLLTHRLWVLAKATHTNDGIGRIRVDIGHRREVDMNAHTLALFSHLLAHLIDQLVIANGTQSHLIGIGKRLVHTHTQAPFGIDADHQRGLRHGLPFVGLLHLRLGIGTEETHATNVIFLDVLGHIGVERFVRIVGTHANELCHTLLQS